MNDILLPILGDLETMELIIGGVVSLLAAYGVPAYIGKLIIQLAPVAVKLVEQQLRNAPNAEKKATAIKAVKEKLPAAVRLIPGVDKRIGTVVDHVVKALPSTKSFAPPTAKELNGML